MNRLKFRHFHEDYYQFFLRLFTIFITKTTRVTDQSIFEFDLI